MRRKPNALHTLTTALLLLWSIAAALPLTAQSGSTGDRKEELRKDMYRYFVTMDSVNFNKTVEQLMALARSQGDEVTLYKAWSNQASYYFSRINRKRGLDICNELRVDAMKHDSKYGLFASSFVNASMLSTIKDYAGAEKRFKECIDYQERYFPDESMAPIYLGLCKVYQNTQRIDDVRACANKALADPHLSKLHRLTALSFICISYPYEDKSVRDEFNSIYAERQKAIEDYGHNDNLADVVDFTHSMLNGDYERALLLTDKMIQTDKLRLKARVYVSMGRWKDAYFTYKDYRDFRDSLNSKEVISQTTASAVQLNVARAENEVKDLRLANQELELRQAENALHQQLLESEAKELALKNREVELRNQEVELKNASMELENATLDGRAKDLELREARAKMMLHHQEEINRKTTERWATAIAAVVLAALAFTFWRRHRQLKKLKGMNEELRQAYNQLEETTTAKERMDSELRIAREIQMSMVPGTFPDRRDLDMAAYMEPAKEVGGDLFNYLLLGDQLYFCVGDVSGKGVPASLFMAQATRLFRTLAAERMKPADIANRLNHELAEGNEQGMFVTMFIGLADLTTGQLDFCNCGHNPPVLGDQFMVVEPNAPVGLWEEMDFTGEQVRNIRGRRLFLYTDGLNESEDTWHTQFGDKRIVQLLKAHPAHTARQTIDMFKAAVAHHAGDAEPSDDLTMMAIRLK